MADPVVHLTAGVPDSGTGNITTLGMLLPIGRTTNPTPAADGAQVAAAFDKLGKQVMVGSLRDLKDSQITTVTAGPTTIVAAVAATYTDIYGLILSNVSATATEVTFTDNTKTYSIYVPAGDTRGFMLPEGGALKATSLNTVWTVTLAPGVTSVKVTALYVKNL